MMSKNKDLSSITELNERNHFLETLINLTPGILYIYDIVAKKNIYSNDGIQKILGYSPQKIKDFGSKIISLLMHPDDFHNYIQETLPKYTTVKDHEQLISEFRMKHTDGSWYWFRSTETIYLRMPDGRPKQIFGMMEDITKQKQSEQLIQQNKKRLDYALQSINTGVWELDLNTLGSWRSLKHDQIFGYEKALSEWTYEMFLEHVVVEDREEVNNNFQRAIKTKTDWHIECRINRKDGAIRWILAQGNHDFDENKKSIKMLGVVQDITERKNSEKILRDSEEKFRALYDNAPLSYQSLNEDGSFKDINPTWLRTLGYKKNEVIGEFYKDFLHPDYQNHFEKNFPVFKKRGYVHDVNFKIRHKSGHYLDITFEGCIGYNPDGSFKQTYCVFTDITKRKRIEKALQESENRFKKAFYTSPDAININRLKDGAYVDVSKGFTELTGYSRNDVLGKNSAEIDIWCIPADREKLVQGLDKNGHYTNLETIFRRKDGSKTTGLTSASIITLNGEAHVLSITRDISQRKKTENKLYEKIEQLNMALQGANAGLWSWNIKAGEDSLDERWCAILGYTKYEIEQHVSSWEKLIHPDDKNRIMSLIQKHLEDEKNEFKEEYRMKCKNGQWKWIFAVGKLVKRDEAGNPAQMTGIMIDIAKRKQAEKELNESKIRFKTISENAPVLINSFDHNGLCLFWNKQCQQTFGWTIEEINEHKIPMALFYPDPAICNKVIDSMNNNPDEKFREWQSITKNGTILNIMWANFKLPNGQTFGIGYNITERKQNENALLKSEEQFRLLYNAMNQGLALHEIILDENGKPIDYVYLDINNRYTELLGITREMAIGKQITKIMPKIGQYWINIFGEVARTGKPNYFENYFETTDRYYSTYTYSPKKNQFAVLVTDISERKEAEHKIATEKELLAVTLRSIGDGVITTDINSNIVMINKVAEKLTGWNAAEAIGRPLSEVFNIIDKVTGKQCFNRANKVLKIGRTVALGDHTCLIAKNGQEIIIADSAAPIHDSNSVIIGVVLVFRDMTEKQAFDEMKQKTQKLESLGILAGGIAHDFNNILSGVFGYIEMARLKTTEIKVLDYLAKSSESIDRASALTQQLLTFAKGGVPIKKVGTLFPFIQKTAQFALSGSSVSSEFQIQKNLSLCNFDKNQIGQVVDNLTINAQQAMPTGGTIQFLAQNIILSEHQHISLPSGHYIKLSIKDSGIGIPKEFLKSIFDPYFTTKSEGHGLGLATCYSIISRHGGSLEVESELGKGTTFHIYLPASIETAPPNIEHLPQEHQGTGTFLVMDDEEMIRYITKEMLESFGYNVILKENGKDTLEFFKAEVNANRKIAGMIFDLTIPGSMGGEEAIGEIRKLCSDTPVFVASGYSVNPIMADPIKYGFTASISKPFRITELSKMLEKHMK